MRSPSTAGNHRALVQVHVRVEVVKGSRGVNREKSLIHPLTSRLQVKFNIELDMQPDMRLIYFISSLALVLLRWLRLQLRLFSS